MKTTKILIIAAFVFALTLIATDRAAAQSCQDETIRWELFDENGNFLPEKLSKEEFAFYKMMETTPKAELPAKVRLALLKWGIMTVDNTYFDEQGYERTKLTREDYIQIGLPSYYYDAEIISKKYVNDLVFKRDASTDVMIHNIQFGIDAHKRYVDRFNKNRPKYLAEIAELEKQIEAEKKAGK